MIDSNIDLEKILPHSAPMILVSKVLNYSLEQKTLQASVTITSNDVFYSSLLDGTPSYVGIEYIAQTVGCLSGIVSLHRNEPIKLGFLLGGRQIKIYEDVFKRGKTYIISIKEILSDKNFSSIEGSITDENNSLIMTATLNAYLSDKTAKDL